MGEEKILRKKLFFQTLITTYIFGFVCHGYRSVSTNFSHDSLLIAELDNGWQISLGRYLQPHYRQCVLGRGALTVPWLLCLVALLWVGIMAYLLIRMLEIKGRGAQILLCGILCTNYSLTVINATYMPWSDVFMFSAMLAVLGCFVFYRESGWISWVGSLLIAASMGLYQSYFGIAVAVMMLMAIKALTDGCNVMQTIKKGLQSVLYLILGGMEYYIGLQLELRRTQIALATSEYNSIAGVGDYSEVNVPALIAGTYQNFADYFIHPNDINYHWAVIASNIALAVACCIFILKAVYSKKQQYALPLTVLLLLLVPFGFNIVFFITKGFMSELMNFPLAFVFVAAIWSGDIYICDLEKAQKLIHVRDKLCYVGKHTVLLLSVFLILNNVVYANGAYLKKELEYQATLSAMTRIVDRLEIIEEYVPGVTPVLFVGGLEGVYTSQRIGFERYTYGEAGIDQTSSTTYATTLYQFIENILNRPVLRVSSEVEDVLCASGEINAMPCFPYQECCKMIDGVAVVRLS